MRRFLTTFATCFVRGTTLLLIFPYRTCTSTTEILRARTIIQEVCAHIAQASPLDYRGSARPDREMAGLRFSFCPIVSATL